MNANHRQLSFVVVAFAAAAGAALFFIGCGAADLYEAPVSPFSVVGRVPLPSENFGVASLDGYAYVAGGQAGLHVIDYSDPTAPLLTTTVNTTKNAESVEVVRTMVGGELVDLALVVEGTEGITTYDITQPESVNSFDQGTTAVDGQRIAVEEPDDPDDPYVVYLAESWKGIRIFESDVTLPGVLTYGGVFAGTQGYAMGIAARDGWVYVADDELGLAVVDARERVLGVVGLVSWADTPGNARDVALDGDYAYVADGVEGLAVFRIQAGDTPVKVAQLDLSAFSRSIAVANGWCLLAADDGGVHVVDVSDPENPEYGGTVDLGGASDVAISPEGYGLVATYDNGLIILDGPDLARDMSAPAPLSTLAVVPYDFTSARLEWLATGDDGLYGAADFFEAKYAATSIDDLDDWAAATPITAVIPAPGVAGSAHEVLADGFDSGETVWFAMVAYDELGNMSALSPSIETTMLSGTAYRDAGVDLELAQVDHVFTFELTWLDDQGRAPANHDLVLDGVRHAMTLESGDPLTGQLYIHETELWVGDHSYFFEFDDGAGNGFVTPTNDDLFVTTAISFTMGSPAGELGRRDDEVAHEVALTRAVVASSTEVTQAMWSEHVAVDPSHFTGDDLPVHNVSWYDAVAFCNLKSTADGLAPAYAIEGLNVSWNPLADGWRLPTEAEWEWLCRAGSTGATPGGELSVIDCGEDAILDTQAWYCGNATAPAAVGAKVANVEGLYDMLGNLREWCWDWYGPYEEGNVLDPMGPETGERRVVRGGSWHYQARECRSAARGAFYPTSADDFVGFRIVRNAPETR